MDLCGKKNCDHYSGGLQYLQNTLVVDDYTLVLTTQERSSVVILKSTNQKVILPHNVVYYKIVIRRYDSWSFVYQDIEGKILTYPHPEEVSVANYSLLVVKPEIKWKSCPTV